MMKVLLCQFGGFGEKIIEHTLIKLGYEVDTIWVKCQNYDYDGDLLKSFADKMAATLPDMVFSLNFLPIISKVCNIYKTIYLSWVYDCPELHIYSAAVTNPVNRIFFFDRFQYQKYKTINNNIYYMHLVTNPMTEVEIAKISSEEHKRFDNDVCFVGSLYNESDRRFQEINNLPKYWQGYIKGIVESQLNVYGYNFIEDALSETTVNELSGLLKYQLIDDYKRVDKEIIADMYIGMMVSSIDRIRTINTLAEQFDVSVYTDCDTSMIKGAHIKGVVDSVNEMPKLLHCSRININVTMKTMRTGIPIRVFDALGVKGFMLTNYQEEICDLFDPGVDLVIYEDMQDLKEKTRYYLEHEDERMQIAENGYRKVCSNYTYETAVKYMLNQIGMEIQ